MEDFFTGIQWFFETILLAPYNALANLELESWWLANFMSWIFILITFVAFFYWLKQLRIFKDNNEDRTDVSAHAFL